MGTNFNVAGNIISPVSKAEARLSALLDTIAGAQDTVCMFAYMFTDDSSGNEVAEALKDAVKRGVSVKLMIDDFGSGDTKPVFFESISHAGVDFRRFSSRWNLSYFVRNHQKILIADGKRAVIGGFNVSDAYFGRSAVHDWEDFGVIIEGDAVARLYEYYQDLFDLDQGDGVSFRKLRKLIRDWHNRTGAVSWQIGGPTNRISPWARRLKRDLERADRIDLVSAYFFPTQSIVRRISKITRKDNGGRLILAGQTDNLATIAAARSLYRYLLKRGARIFEFTPRPLHMKLLVIDDVSYIGSSNLDVRSLFINMEIMLRVDDTDFADYLRAKIADMAEQSEEQTLELHRSRSGLFGRIKNGLAFLLVNSVDYTVGRRIKFGLLRKK